MTSLTTDRLSPARLQYEEQGYVVFRNVLDPGLIEETDRHVAWLLAKHPELRPEQLGWKLVHGDPFWVRLVGDDRLLDIAEQFIGSDIALFASHYICKPPFDGRPVLWHQDGSYWPLDPMEVTTLWLAVDDSTPENGCMRVIPGSHKMALQEMVENSAEDNVLHSEIPVEHVDESKAVNIELKKGDVSIHHPNIIHGSKANRSPNRRCGLTIRYIPTSTRVLKEDMNCIYLLRGKPVSGINNYQPRPTWREGEHMSFRGCENWKA